MKQINRVITTAVVVLFLLNCILPDVSLAFGPDRPPSDTLAVPSVCDDLVGMQHKDIGRIQLALEAELVTVAGKGLPFNADTFIKMQDLTVAEKTVFNPAHVQFCFRSSEMRGSSILVKCKVMETDGIMPRVYYALFSKGRDGHGGFPIDVYTDNEYKRFGHLLGVAKPLKPGSSDMEKHKVHLKPKDDHKSGDVPQDARNISQAIRGIWEMHNVGEKLGQPFESDVQDAFELISHLGDQLKTQSFNIDAETACMVMAAYLYGRKREHRAVIDFFDHLKTGATTEYRKSVFNAPYAIRLYFIARFMDTESLKAAIRKDQPFLEHCFAELFAPQDDASMFASASELTADGLAEEVAAAIRGFAQMCSGERDHETALRLVDNFLLYLDGDEKAHKRYMDDEQKPAFVSQATILSLRKDMMAEKDAVTNSVSAPVPVFELVKKKPSKKYAPGEKPGSGDMAAADRSKGWQKKVLIVYHSGSGGTKAVSDVFSQRLSEKYSVEMIEANAAFNGDLSHYDMVLFGFPTFRLRPSPSIMEFVERLPRSAKPVKAYVFCTKSTVSNNTLRIFAKSLSEKNIVMRGSAEFRAPATDVSLDFPQVLTGFLYRLFGYVYGYEKDIRGKIERSASSIDNIIESPSTELVVPAWKLSTLFWWPIQKYIFDDAAINVAPLEIIAERCKKCGQCALRFCPRGAWKVAVESMPEWIKEKCDRCMSCVHKCPAKAIVYNEKMKDNPRLDKRFHEQARKMLSDSDISTPAKGEKPGSSDIDTAKKGEDRFDKDTALALMDAEKFADVVAGLETLVANSAWTEFESACEAVRNHKYAGSMESAMKKEIMAAPTDGADRTRFVRLYLISFELNQPSDVRISYLPTGTADRGDKPGSSDMAKTRGIVAADVPIVKGAEKSQVLRKYAIWSNGRVAIPAPDQIIIKRIGDRSYLIIDGSGVTRSLTFTAEDRSAWYVTEEKLSKPPAKPGSSDMETTRYGAEEEKKEMVAALKAGDFARVSRMFSNHLSEYDTYLYNRSRSPAGEVVAMASYEKKVITALCGVLKESPKGAAYMKSFEAKFLPRDEWIFLAIDFGMDMAGVTETERATFAAKYGEANISPILVDELESVISAVCDAPDLKGMVETWKCFVSKKGDRLSITTSARFIPFTADVARAAEMIFKERGRPVRVSDEGVLSRIKPGSSDMEAAEPATGPDSEIIREIASMKETAASAGLMIPTHSSKRYTLLMASEFFSNGELEEHRRAYGDLFNLDRISGSTPEQFIDNVIAKAGGIGDRVIALIPNEIRDEGQLKRLTAAGIRFMRTDVGVLREMKSGNDVYRKKFQLDTYVTMLLARRIDDNTPEGSPVYRMLAFYLKSHFALDGGNGPQAIRDYIDAIRKNDITGLLKGILSYRPIQVYDAAKDYESIAKVLVAA